ncbi:MAG: chorismate mutase [Chloroflexi bacterium]|nr:chorismate mutase [Chloroflexota bacterium]
MRCRGIRGATTVESNTGKEILEATKELLRLMIDANSLDKNEIAIAVFTTTEDLNAEFPAMAARQIGWTEVPLLCAREINVPGSLKKCLRILLLVNTEKSPAEIVHIYVKGAKDLRNAIETK